MEIKTQFNVGDIVFVPLSRGYEQMPCPPLSGREGASARRWQEG